MNPQPHGTNPYAPPTGGVAAPQDVVPSNDTSELFVQTLPSPALRAAGLCAVVTGLLLFFMCFRFVIVGVRGTVVTAAESAMIVGGILEIAVAWGVTGGRVATWFLALALAPLVGIVSLVTLLTGSIAGLFGIAMCVGNVVLLGVSFADVRRVGAARAALRRQLLS